MAAQEVTEQQKV